MQSTTLLIALVGGLAWYHLVLVLSLLGFVHSDLGHDMVSVLDQKAIKYNMIGCKMMHRARVRVTTRAIA